MRGRVEERDSSVCKRGGLRVGVGGASGRLVSGSGSESESAEVKLKRKDILVVGG